jgi:hypothetical protein
MTYSDKELVYDFLVCFPSRSNHPNIQRVFENESSANIPSQTTTLALRNVAVWALPLLKQANHPTFLVTSSLLWRDPIPPMFALSSTKASQRTLVLSLQKLYPDVHIALLNVAGPVSEGDGTLKPGNVAEEFCKLYKQEQGNWKGEVDMLWDPRGE